MFMRLEWQFLYFPRRTIVIDDGLICVGVWVVEERNNTISVSDVDGRRDRKMNFPDCLFYNNIAAISLNIDEDLRYCCASGEGRILCAAIKVLCWETWDNTSLNVWSSEIAVKNGFL